MQYTKRTPQNKMKCLRALYQTPPPSPSPPQDDSEASFSTEPQTIQLYLPEILDQFPGCFPLEVMMFLPELADDDTDDLPSHLTTDKVTLTHTSIESAIVATTEWDNSFRRCQSMRNLSSGLLMQ